MGRMIFTKTRRPGVQMVDIERREDERGFSARCWCRNEFDDHALA